MSRPVIAAISAALIAALCGAAYLVTTASLESRIRRDLRDRVANAQDLLLRTAELRGLELFKSARELARDDRLSQALGEGANREPAMRAFIEFRRGPGDREPPDILALTDAGGRLVTLFSGEQPIRNPIASTYLEGGRIKYPALAIALSDRIAIADVWPYENQGPMEIAVAPIIDSAGVTLGAVLIAHAISSDRASRERRLLGADIAYFHDGDVRAASLAGKLPASVFADGGIARVALASDKGISDVVTVEVDGEPYIATAGRLPLFSSLGDRPPGYGPPRSGTVVAMSVAGALSALEPVKLTIAMIGLGALVIMLLAMFLTARQILGPIDDLEIAVAEMLDGNLDRTFEASGSDVDGLANGLNVLMARLLGRPEPGEEEYDSEGNLIQPSTSMQIATVDVAALDDEAAALAREPEDAYYARIYDEYTAAIKRTGGSVAGLTEEAFINKLRFHEATLREKYECSEVRFIVATEGENVILQPVPLQ